MTVEGAYRKVSMSLNWWHFIHETLKEHSIANTPVMRATEAEILHRLRECRGDIDHSIKDQKKEFPFLDDEWQLIILSLQQRRDAAPKGIAGIGTRATAQLIVSHLDLKRVGTHTDTIAQLARA